MMLIRQLLTKYRASLAYVQTMIEACVGYMVVFLAFLELTEITDGGYPK
jgi:hypothetical protein